MTWLIFDTTTSSLSFSSAKTTAPDYVIQLECSDDDQQKILSGMYEFNAVERRVVQKSSVALAEIATQKSNAEKSHYLSSTDWKILRHLREKMLQVQTSMTEQEFIALEQERQAIAKSIV